MTKSEWRSAIAGTDIHPSSQWQTPNLVSNAIATKLNAAVDAKSIERTRIHRLRDRRSRCPTRTRDSVLNTASIVSTNMSIRSTIDKYGLSRLHLLHPKRS